MIAYLALTGLVSVAVLAVALLAATAGDLAALGRV